jgi:phage shock protein A
MTTNKVERIESARMDRLERVALERHNTLLELLERMVDRIGKLESVCALVLAHVSTDNTTYARMQRTIDDLDKRVKELESERGA